MAMYRNGFHTAALVTPIVDPFKWVEQKVPASRVKIARTAIAHYDPFRWLLSHATIIASVDVDSADSKDKKSNYLIKPEYSAFVNNNGDCWERELLKVTYKTFLGADNFCFPAGTRVLMSDGTYKAIELIKEGDKVINRKGEIGIVTKTFTRGTEDLVELSGTNVLSRKIFATDNHPFWVYRARKTCPKTGRPNLFDKDKDFWHLDTWRGFSVGVHTDKDEEYPSGLTPDWVKASEIDSDHEFFTHPISSVEVSNEEVNINRAELIGWFLAEGSYDQKNVSSEEESGVSFALGNDEIDIANRLSELLIKEFGDNFRADCKPRIYETQSGSYTLTISNKKVADYFKKWCGKYAWAKKLPEEAMWLPKNLQAVILKNCICGDGSGAVVSRGYSLEMKSQALIQQFNWISWRLGLLPTYRETGVLPRYTECEIVDGFEIYLDPSTGKKSRPGYLLRFSTRDSKKLNEIVDIEDLLMSDRLSKKYAHSFYTEEGKWIVSKIDYTKATKLRCTVYNIEVEGDNSYVVEGVIVHNCEHVQIPELSKGKVIDVALREVPIGKDVNGKDINTLYVDILIATNKDHVDLVEKIKDGSYNSVSMGCLIAYSQCSKCGRIAADETKLCNDIKFYKKNYFFDKNGIKRIIAELCGRAEDPGSCKFIDASWVRKPAFAGAVLRNLVEPSPDISEKITRFVNVPSFEPQPGMILRAASEAASLVKEIKAQDEKPQPEKSDSPPVLKDPAAKDPAAPAKDDTDFPAGPESDTPLKLDEPPTEGASPGTPPAEGAAPGAPPEGSPMPPPEGAPAEPQIQEPSEDATVKEVEDMMTKQILNKIRRKLLKDEVQQKIPENERPMDNTSTNSTFIKDANIRAKLIKLAKDSGNERLLNGIMILSNIKDWNNFKKYGYTKNDVIGLLHFVDKNISANPIGSDAVMALSRIKAASDDPTAFFTEMIIETGRKPTVKEAKKLIKWAKIISNFKDV
jgi:intein/homing endonuclease